MPLNLHATRVNETFVVVNWSHPEYLGERTDLYYIVEISDPDNVGQMVEVMNCDPNNACLKKNSCNITSLQPATTYVIRVTAHNGVSDQDRGGALARQKEITVKTDNARECTKITNIVIHSTNHNTCWMKLYW